MFKFIPVLGFFLIHLLDHALSGPPNQKFRKSELFLTKDAIPGDGGFVPPEDFIPQSIIPPRPRTLSSNDPQLKVLEGNYPKADMQIPTLDEYERREAKKLTGRFFDLPSLSNIFTGLTTGIQEAHKSFKKATPFLDPIREVILGKPKDEPGTGGKLPIDIGLLTGGLTGFLKQVTECTDHLRMCTKTELFNPECYLHCVIGAHPIGQALVSAVVPNLKFLCDSIGTFFEQSIVLFANWVNRVKTLKDYVAFLNLPAPAFKTFVRTAINGVPSCLIKFIDNDLTNPLKKFFSDLQTAALEAGKGVNLGANKLVNEACSLIEPMTPVQSLASVFFSAPKAFDIMLPGSWMVGLISYLKVLKGTIFSALMDTFQRALSLIGGLKLGCSILQMSEAGDMAPCTGLPDLALGKKPVPPEKGKNAVCGTVPYYPPHLIDNEYPSIFRDTEGDVSTTTTEETIAITHPPLSGKSQVNPIFDFSKVDKIINADVEYDDD